MTKEHHQLATSLYEMKLYIASLVRRPFIKSSGPGRILHAIGMPGLIAPFEYKDGTHNISVRTSPRYTILSVDSLELFFYRENGGFDGVGGMALDAAMPFDCKVDDIQQAMSVHEAVSEVQRQLPQPKQ